MTEKIKDTVSKTIIGIDNGVTGSIGIVDSSSSYFYKTPVFLTQDYTKKKQNVSRLDCKVFYNIIENVENPFAVIERPMVNPQRYRATLSAVRCLESTLICLETLSIPYQFVDSKEWQKVMLNSSAKTDDLKKLSRDIGIRLFPKHKEFILKHKDADSLLMAEWARRCNL